MVAIVNQKRSVVEDLCRQHHVKRLDLFGSAATSTFDSAGSDLDFAVEFQSLSPVDRAAAYFGLLAAFQDLFEREVDLVEIEAISNPYFLKSLNASRQVVYAA